MKLKTSLPVVALLAGSLLLSVGSAQAGSVMSKPLQKVFDKAGCDYVDNPSIDNAVNCEAAD